MYNLEFFSKTGKSFLLSAENGIVFDAENLSGLSVTLGTSQGFSQIGETVNNQAVSGNYIPINGVVRDNSLKARLLSLFAPFQSGYLVFNRKHYLPVIVKDSPRFSPVKGDGTFSMRFYAPFPFWRSVDVTSADIGKVEPAFSFPVNYSQPHQFGVKSAARYVNVKNGGAIRTCFRLDFSASDTVSGITVTNLQTKQFLKLNGTLRAGQTISIYWTDENQLVAQLHDGGETRSIISWIDNGSTLYELEPGDNMIQATDAQGGGNLTTHISFREVVGGVYED